MPTSHVSTARICMHLLRQMIRIRRFEEKCVELYQAQKIRGFLHLYNGEEAVAVGVMQALGPGGRRRRHLSRARPALVRGVPMDRGDGRDVRQARRLLPRPRRLDAHVRPRPPGSTAATRSSAAACRSPSAWRWPTRCRARNAVTACFFGEGAVAEGEFHESLNLAALWRLPVLFVCENNLYAMGTALERSGIRDRHRPQGRRLSHSGRGRRRHGRRGRRSGGTARRRRRPQRRRATFSRMPDLPVPRAFDVRCRSSIATRPRSKPGAQKDPIERFQAGCESDE